MFRLFEGKLAFRRMVLYMPEKYAFHRRILYVSGGGRREAPMTALMMQPL
jgi:hypothetical protein